MSDELRDIIAEALWIDYDSRGDFSKAADYQRAPWLRKADVILSALKASRHEVVKLPVPMSEGRPEIAAGNGAVTSHDGHDVLIAFPGEGHRLRSPRMARVLAGSILASAADADGAR